MAAWSFSASSLFLKVNEKYTDKALLQVSNACTCRMDGFCKHSMSEQMYMVCVADIECYRSYRPPVYSDQQSARLAGNP